MTKRKKRSVAWLHSEYLWLALGGLVFTSILIISGEKWAGILALVCYSISLGLRIVDRMPEPAPTDKPSAPVVIAGQMRYTTTMRKAA